MNGSSRGDHLRNGDRNLREFLYSEGEACDLKSFERFIIYLSQTGIFSLLLLHFNVLLILVYSRFIFIRGQRCRVGGEKNATKFRS